jgi:hypothetical protein
MKHLVKGFVKWLKLVGDNGIVTVDLMELSTPVAFKSDDGREVETSYIGMMLDTVLSHRFGFAAADKDGAPAGGWIIGWGESKGHAIINGESIFLQVARKLAEFGFLLDIEGSTMLNYEECRCGQCSPEEIERTRDGVAQARADVERLVGSKARYEAEHRVDASNHPENVKATSKVPAEAMPEDPFVG